MIRYTVLFDHERRRGKRGSVRLAGGDMLFEGAYAIPRG